MTTLALTVQGPKCCERQAVPQGSACPWCSVDIRSLTAPPMAVKEALWWNLPAGVMATLNGDWLLNDFGFTKDVS